MTGDCHAGICGSPGVRFPRATRPGCINYPGISLAGARLLARWCPAWRRREPDQAAFAWNVRRRAPIPLSSGMATGSVPGG